MTPKLTTELQRVVKAHDGGPVEVDGDNLPCVLMTVDVYRSMFGDLAPNDQDFAESVAGIQRGLDSVEQGEGIPLRDADEMLRQKHNIPRST